MKRLPVFVPIVLFASAACAAPLLAVDGQCTKLVVAGVETEGTPLLTSEDDGSRAIFGFPTRDDVIEYSMTGPTVHTDDGEVMRAVDRVVTHMGRSIAVAVGSCRFGNPFAGRATVLCYATTDGGVYYIGKFETDGHAPHEMREK